MLTDQLGRCRRGRARSTILPGLVILLALSGCGSLPKDVSRPISHAYTDAETSNTRLGRARRDEIRRHPGESGFLLLGNGLDAFVGRAALAQYAERSIDAQYYLLHGDLTGILFVDQLIKAADRGVRVRLLIDDMDLGGRDVGAAALDSHPNIEVRLFNPFGRGTNRTLQMLTRFGSVTRRMHNKSFTVDNRATILGGRNIGDEYFNADPEVAFYDMDVMLIGPAVAEVSDSFDRYWNSDLAYPANALLGREPTVEETRGKRAALDAFVAGQEDSAYLRALASSDLANSIRANRVVFEWGDAHVVHDAPEKIDSDRAQTQYHMAPQLRPYFDGVKKELLIFSPYFVPGKTGTAFLTNLSRRGVRVRVVTNSLASTDVPVVHSGYAKYRKPLLRGGVELYELKAVPQLKLSGKEDQVPPELGIQRTAKKTKASGGYGSAPGGSSKASLHSKVFIFDRREIFIGSLNLDLRSVRENTEIGVVLTAPTLAADVAKSVDGALERVAFRLELQSDQDGRERIVWKEQNNGTLQVHQTEPDTGFWQQFGVGLMGLLPIESQL